MSGRQILSHRNQLGLADFFDIDSKFSDTDDVSLLVLFLAITPQITYLLGLVVTRRVVFIVGYTFGKLSDDIGCDPSLLNTLFVVLL